MNALPQAIKIVEVGPRDGLQNEPDPIPTEIKVAFIKALGAAGVQTIEATSFVHPKWVPQLADGQAVLSALDLDGPIRYPVLIPNLKGLSGAQQTGVKEIAVFTAASETFNQKNINASINESFERIQAIVDACASTDIKIRGYLSTCFACPYEGLIDPAQVWPLVTRLLELGCFEVSLGDTIGAAHPGQVEAFFAIRPTSIDINQLAVHFHDTRGRALANIMVALQEGITVIDSSAGGLGGCPYAPGAAGNVATEDVVWLLEDMGIATGVQLNKLIDAINIIAPYVKRPITTRGFAFFNK